MTKDNTPPRSPEMDPDVFFDENDIIEEINLEEEGFAMETESVSSDENEHQRRLPERDDSIVTFTKHTESVMSCAFHPTQKNVVITGGMDDIVYAWEVTSSSAEDGGYDIKVLFESKHAGETVDCVKFSCDGKYLVAVDLLGKINLFNGQTFEHISAIEVSDEFMFLDWHPSAPVFVIGTNSLITMYSVPKYDIKYLSTSPATSHRCGRIFPDGKRLAIGLDVGTLRVYDLKTSALLITVKPFQSEQGDVVCLDVQKDNSAILCGCSLGYIFVANPETGKFTLYPSPIGETEYVEDIGFAKTTGSHALAASGHGSGYLRIWDSARQQLRHEHRFGSGITRMLWHPNELIVFTSHTLGNINMFDARSGTLLKEFLGHTDSCLSLDINLNFALGPALLSTSEDVTARIFLIDQEQPTDP